MALDTGADETCFPASIACKFGHDNKHPKVEVIKDAVRGIGGPSDAFIHSVQIGLLHPSKSSTKSAVIAWVSPLTKAPFIEKLDSPCGLIGMDIMRHWRSVNFEITKQGILIRISI
jgi:hypothetical protein